MRLTTENYDRMLEKCTAKEIDFLLYICQFQDEYGNIVGITYKDVMEKANLKKSTYYKVLYSLEEKEFVKINWNSTEYAHWEIKIINNVFVCSEDYKKGYIKLNYEILHSKEFIALTRCAKVIILNLLKIKDFYKEKIKLTYERLLEWTSSSKRSLSKFLNALSKIFNITFAKKYILIDTYFQVDEKSEKDVRGAFYLNYKLNKHKCQYSSDREFKDCVRLINQYFNKTTVEKILDAVETMIKVTFDTQPKFLNKLLYT